MASLRNERVVECMISIIIPVYEVEQFLDKCILSVVNQSYKELEIILVDDGTSDKCAQMCEKWIKEDNRIIVIHKKNEGLSVARNTGVSASSGGWIGFVDSDDWINPNMYKDLLDAIDTYNAEIAECNWERITPNIEYSSSNLNEDLDSCQVVDSKRAIFELIHDGQFKQTVVNKLYKREVVMNIAFPKGKLNEDEFWTYRVFGQADIIVKIDSVLYYYFQREGSITHCTYNPNRLDAIEAKKQRTEYLDENYPQLVPESKADFANTCFFHFQAISRAHIDDNRDYRNSLYSDYCSVKLSIILNGKSLKQRIWHIMFRLFPYLTTKIRNGLGIGI